MHPPESARRFALRPTASLLVLCAALAIGACGETWTVGVTVNAVGDGERFEFSLGPGQLITVTKGGTSVTFPQRLATDATYTVNQTSGPRSCTLSSNRTGVIGTANVEVTADCGRPPGSSTLTGKVYGPVGSQVVLQLNGRDDLTVTVVHSPSAIDPYDATAFTFATPLPDGADYQVTVKTPPPGQVCSVYKGASGTMPVTATGVRVGCEYSIDLATRSSDDAVRGTFYETSAPSVGGSNAPIGATRDGYGEGRFIAFVSNAAGLAGNSSAHRQVFFRDVWTGETKLVSKSSAGVEGNGDSWAPAVSADGLVVVFESTASNLVSGDTNGVSDVFGWDARNPSATPERLSVGPGGVEANGGSFEPTVSADGSVCAFSSVANNLTPGVSGTNTRNVYRRQYDTSLNTLVSASTAGVGVGGSKPVLSEDGTRLAFYSFASNIVAGDGNGLWDVFVYDHSTGARTRVSLTNGGGERNQGDESASREVAPAISGNGRYVAWASTATNVVSGDTNTLQDVFVSDTQTGAVVRASLGAGGVQGNGNSPIGQGERVALSSDGVWVAFSTSATNLGAGTGSSSVGNVVVHNLVTGETRAVTDQTSGDVGAAVMSRSAAYVVFGASNKLDPRFTSTGLFSRFTGIARAWWWID